MRIDDLGLKIPMLVLSTEENPVVAARCRKLDLPGLQGLKDKKLALLDFLKKRRFDSTQVVYLGNDINDLPCFPVVGCAVVVADAHPDVLRSADMVLSQKGGFGGVRELCDMILARKEKGNL